jgi:transcriptional regulator with XRE-family HTH domain
MRVDRTMRVSLRDAVAAASMAGPGISSGAMVPGVKVNLFTQLAISGGEFPKEGTGMYESEDPDVIRRAVLVARAIHNWSQAELAAAADVSVSTVSRCESGEQMPTRGTFDRLMAAAGVSPRHQRQLFSWLRKSLAPPGTGICDKLLDGASAELIDTIERLTEVTLSPEEQQSEVDQALALLEKRRREAEELWARLESFPPEERFFLVEKAPEYHRWELCTLLCELNLDASADEAQHQELAALALHVAAQVLEAGKTGKDTPAEIREAALANWDLFVARRREHNPLGWSSAKARAFFGPKE